MKIKQVNQVKRINEILTKGGYLRSNLASILPINFASFLVLVCYIYIKTEGKIIYLRANKLEFFIVKGLSGKIMLNKDNKSFSYHTTSESGENTYVLVTSHYTYYPYPYDVYFHHSSFNLLVRFYENKAS